MRFTTPTQKAIVIAVLVAVDIVLVLLFDALHSEAGSIVLTVLQALGWYIATRTFRGPGESPSAARPWWRMTNRWLLSAVLGGVYALSALANAVFSVAGYGSLSGWVSVLAQAALAALFLTSASRLRALARVPA
ncbi:hypothetical protein [Leifsonia naganoensis]|uniref:Uncharacterized protein n=1 Tax=Leifsonia naganoensis TaxID=150025 RepID=A0A853DUA3_9MICO|nr:hypothetical protein [Leifsonia naganoensis]NYK09670.1 hypothetical protein [Leifsonia naganoensis]